MKRILIAAAASFALATPCVAFAAPDETQKMLIQRALEAKQKLAAAKTTFGRERERLLWEHFSLMQDVLARMRSTKPRDELTLQETREWIDEHLRLMDLMLGEMMDEHHSMLEGFGK